MSIFFIQETVRDNDVLRDVDIVIMQGFLNLAKICNFSFYFMVTNTKISFLKKSKCTLSLAAL